MNKVIVTPNYTPMKHDMLRRVKKCRECGVEFHQAASDPHQYRTCMHCKWINNYGWSDSNFKGLKQLNKNLEKKFFSTPEFFGSFTNKHSWYHFSREKDSGIIKIWENNVIERTGESWCAAITVMQWFTAVDTMLLLSETVRKASTSNEADPLEYVSYIEGRINGHDMTPKRIKHVMKPEEIELVKWLVTNVLSAGFVLLVIWLMFIRGE
jgi:hypothetical protein